MSVRITTDAWASPNLNRYGEIEIDLTPVELHVAATITHNVVSITVDGTEVNLSHTHASRLAAAILQTIHDNLHDNR